MTIALKQNNVITEVGPGGILHSLFSTIAFRVEKKWGGKFPVIMNELYHGGLTQAHARTALQEIRAIKQALAMLPAQDVIWDIDDPGASGPWGGIGPHIQNASQFHVTKNGRNLLNEIEENIEAIIRFGGDLEIISYNDGPPIL